jgi:hypothetical protein
LDIRVDELQNVNSIDSKIGSLQNSIQQVQNGQIIRGDVAKQIADAAESLVNVIEQAAQNKTASFKANAQVNGVGEAWDNYKRLSSGNTNDPLGLGIGSSGSSGDPLKLGFNGLGSGSGNAQEFDAMRFAAAIGQFESGGKYSAIGPDTGNGNRALGRYQVMASNVPSWTKEALGYSLTPEQFLKDQKAQDAVAQYKMAQYYEKHKNLADVASIWFSGRPVSKAGNAKDVIGTSVPQYVKNVLAIYNRNA